MLLEVKVGKEGVVDPIVNHFPATLTLSSLISLLILISQFFAVEHLALEEEAHQKKFK